MLPHQLVGPDQKPKLAKYACTRGGRSGDKFRWGRGPEGGKIVDTGQRKISLVKAHVTRIRELKVGAERVTWNSREGCNPTSGILGNLDLPVHQPLLSRHCQTKVDSL